jgi:hypothetical protein
MVRRAGIIVFATPPGLHPCRDEKSAEAFESKSLTGSRPVGRVRKDLKPQRLDIAVVRRRAKESVSYCWSIGLFGLKAKKRPETTADQSADLSSTYIT